MELTSEQRKRYAEDGFLLVPSVFSERECDAFVAHVLACKDAQQPGGGPYRARSPGGGALDPELGMALHPRLRAPLRGCMEADGWGRGAEADMIQAMFFWQGSDQDHHQGTYTPLPALPLISAPFTAV